MQLTQEQVRVGQDNYREAVGFTRRDFIKGAAAAGTGLGALYFGYKSLEGKPVKVAFIGTGDEGSVLLTEHPPEYMEIVAIADLRPTNRKKAFIGHGNEARIGLNKKLGEEKAKGIKIFNDHKSLLAAKDALGIEAVVIAVPLGQHYALSKDALEAGLHVLSEKLMAHNVTQCKDLIKLAKEKKLLYAVGHQRHYSVLYENASKIVERGLLGDIKHIRAQWHRNNSFPNRDSWRDKVEPEDKKELESTVQNYGYKDVEQLVNWRLYNETGGGLMAELGSHQLDACSIFLGHKHPIAVQGFGGRNFYGVPGVGSPDKQKDKREIDDHVYVTLEFPGKNYDREKNPDDICIVTYSSINTNRWEPYGETVFGSRGTLMVKTEKEALLYKEESPSTGPGGPDQRLWVVDKADGGGAVLDAYETTAPTSAAASVDEKISRGYTEEMEHFCYCVRTKNYSSPAEGGLRCNGEVAMADAIMALASNLAMKYKKRIVFKDEWFDYNSPAAPETDPEVVGTKA